MISVLFLLSLLVFIVSLHHTSGHLTCAVDFFNLIFLRFCIFFFYGGQSIQLVHCVDQSQGGEGIGLVSVRSSHRRFSWFLRDTYSLAEDVLLSALRQPEARL